MQVVLEALSGLERRLKITVPANRVDQEIETRLQDLVKRAKIDGFRPGKIPLSVVRQRFGTAVRDEVIIEVIRSTYVDALRQEKLRPAGDPRMELTTTESGKSLEYVATFEIYPTIQLHDLSNVTIEELQAEVTDQDVEQMLAKLQKQRADWEEVDRPAQKGDRVVVDFVGSMNGEVFEGGTAKNMKIELGSGMMIPGFEEGLIGAKANDKLELDVHFPKNYQVEKFADKPAKFEVVVHKVMAPKLAELDDKFAEKMGIKKGGIEQLRREIRNNMDRELKRVLRNQIKEQLLEKFLAANTVELPNILVEAEISKLSEQASQQYAAQNGADKAPAIPKENFAELAKTRVGLGLLFAEFIKTHQLKADPAKVRMLLEEMAASYQQPEQVIAWYYNNKEQLAQIETLALEEQVIDILLNQVTKTPKLTTFNELMNPKAETADTNG